MPSISYQESVTVSLDVVVLDSSQTLDSIVEGLNQGKFCKSLIDNLIYDDEGKKVAKIIDVAESDVETDFFHVESKD